MRQITRPVTKPAAVVLNLDDSDIVLAYLSSNRPTVLTAYMIGMQPTVHPCALIIWNDGDSNLVWGHKLSSVTLEQCTAPSSLPGDLVYQQKMIDRWSPRSSVTACYLGRSNRYLRWCAVQPLYTGVHTVAALDNNQALLAPDNVETDLPLCHELHADTQAILSWRHS